MWIILAAVAVVVIAVVFAIKVNAEQDTHEDPLESTNLSEDSTTYEWKIPYDGLLYYIRTRKSEAETISWFMVQTQKSQKCPRCGGLILPYSRIGRDRGEFMHSPPCLPSGSYWGKVNADGSYIPANEEGLTLAEETLRLGGRGRVVEFEPLTLDECEYMMVGLAPTHHPL
jgi:hypothetical protein